jgi:hypothetical protein
VVDSSSNASSTQTSTLTWIVSPSHALHHLLFLSASSVHPTINSEARTDTSTRMTLTTFQNWYTSLPGHDYFCDVHEDFIEDDFNLTGMSVFFLFSTFISSNYPSPFNSRLSTLKLRSRVVCPVQLTNRSTIINPILERSIRNGP